MVLLNMSKPTIPEDAPSPRLCTVNKWPEFQGYGFNLHSEKHREGQYIGKVDPDSPAEAAGLKPRDRIIEVNGVNISMENHRQVVERIKSKSNETTLLVLDPDADEYYKEKGIIVKGDQDNVLVLQNPTTKAGDINGDAELPLETLEKQSNESEDEELQPKIINQEEPPPYKEDADKNGEVKHPDSNASSVKEDDNSLDTTSVKSIETPPVSSPSPDIKENKDFSRSGSEQSEGASPSPPPDIGGLNLNMTAAQMREQLSTRKKKDPRKEKLDFRKKYNIVHSL